MSDTSYAAFLAERGEVRVDPRASLKTGVRWIDHLVTMQTGKALPGQTRPGKRLSNVAAWLRSTSALFISGGLNLALISWASTTALTPLTAVMVGVAYAALTLVTVGRLRSQQVTYSHFCIHNSLSRKRWINDAVGLIALVLPLAQDKEEYADDHIRRHHRKATFTTLDDPDAAFLDSLGFRPGMTKKALWRRLFLTLISPRFHLAFLKARLNSAFITATLTHRMAALAWTGFLGLLGIIFGWPAFLLAVIFPMTVFYHWSSLLQFLTEHKWAISKTVPVSDDEYAERCVGRFCGEAAPSNFSTPFGAFAAWAGWALRMALIHAPTRVAVLVGDLPVHDAHHLVGRLKLNPYAWRDAPYEREAAIQNGDRLGLGRRERWGLKAMIDWVFEGYAGAR